MRLKGCWGRSVPFAISAESGRQRGKNDGPGTARIEGRAAPRPGKRREEAAVPLPSGTAWEGTGSDFDGGEERRAEQCPNASGTATGERWGHGKEQPPLYTAWEHRTPASPERATRSPDTAARAENGANCAAAPSAAAENPPSSSAQQPRNSNKREPGPQRPRPRPPRSTRRDHPHAPLSPGRPAPLPPAPPAPPPVTSRAPPPRRRPRPLRSGPAHRHGVTGGEGPAAALQWAGRAGGA